MYICVITFTHVDAFLHGVETRTSSPIQISRDADSFECVNVARLYPTGEGAGYAGGIVRCVFIYLFIYLINLSICLAFKLLLFSIICVIYFIVRPSTEFMSLTRLLQ